MKKKLMILAVLVAGLFFATSLAIAKEVPITEKNIALLKDRWEGDRSVSAVSGGRTEYRKTEVEITNDTLPLEGVIILHFKLGEPDRLEFKNGILEKGKIFIQRENDIRQWWKFSLYSKDEKMELRGEYQIVKPGGYDILIGDFILRKK